MKLLQILLIALLPFATLAHTQDETMGPPEPEYQLQRYPQFPEFSNLHYGTGKYIIINRVSQQLIVVEDFNTILAMKVIIGKRGWRTPKKKNVFIEFVIFNPYWNVPMSISVRELIPKIKKNMGKYRKLGYEVIHNGKIYDVAAVNDFNPKDIRIRQQNGTNNVLGKIKYKLSKNMGSIFLHDTSAKKLFNIRADTGKGRGRKLSHGCVRLAEPLMLLNIISNLEYKPGAEKWHKLKNPTPVYIVDWKRITN